MKITIETTDSPKWQEKVTMECMDESTIDEVVERMCRLLVAYGYAEESVKDAIITQADDYVNQEADREDN